MSNQIDPSTTLTSPLITEIGSFYIDSIDDVSVYASTSDWQRNLHPRYRPGVTQQTLPVKQDTLTLPPLSDFPVTPQLSKPTNAIHFPFQKRGPIRRDTFLFFYVPVDCPCGASCINWFCPLSHSVLEKMFHPLIYRGGRCHRRQCSFLHAADDDIRGTNLWFLWERQWNGFRLKKDVVRSYIFSISPNKGESDKLLRLLNVVCAVRLGRATPEEKSIAKGLYDDPSSISKFEEYILRQKLNPLLMHDSMQKVAKLIAASVSDNAELTSRCVAKIEGLKAYYIDIISRCRSIASNEYSSKAPPEQSEYKLSSNRWSMPNILNEPDNKTPDSKQEDKPPSRWSMLELDGDNWGVHQKKNTDRPERSSIIPAGEDLFDNWHKINRRASSLSTQASNSDLVYFPMLDVFRLKDFHFVEKPTDEEEKLRGSTPAPGYSLREKEHKRHLNYLKTGSFEADDDLPPIHSTERLPNSTEAHFQPNAYEDL